MHKVGAETPSEVSLERTRPPQEHSPRIIR